MNEETLKEIFAPQLEAMPGLYVFFITPGSLEELNMVKWEVSKLDQLPDHLNNNNLVYHDEYVGDLIPHFVYKS